MEPKITLSIEESIQRLKAEVIAQDWRLSPNRASQLEAAFTCLRQRFKARKATHAMLVMAGSTLNYIKNKGGNPPETIDFLKEAMAHVVNLYEELSYDPEKEDQIFQKLFARFSKLKEKVKNKPAKPLAPLPVDDVQAQPEENISSSSKSVHLSSTAPEKEDFSGNDVESLISDLKTTLEKAGEVGSAIGRVLEELIEKHKGPTSSESSETKVPETSQERPTVFEQEILTEQTPQVVAPPKPKIEPCPPTELKELHSNGKTIAVTADSISLVRSVKPNKMSKYIRDSCVDLKDFSSLFQGLAKQFKGSLSNISDNKLKQLKLPIITPQKSDLQEAQSEKASMLVIISNGNWHGVLPCTSVFDAQAYMVQFEKKPNGDIAGLGHLDNGEKVELLDLQRILRREGFLVMV